jgi:O-antigen/teichoic acid export membrane protein
VRFSRDVAATFGARLLLVVLGVISSVLTARLLGPSGRGVLATLAALTGIGIQLGNLGLHSSNTYQVSRCPALLGTLWANSRRTASIVGALLTLLTVGAVLAAPRLVGGIPVTLLILAAVGIPFHLAVLFGLNLVVGMGRLPLFNLLEVIFRTAGVAGAFVLLVLLGKGLPELIAFNLMVTVAAALILARTLRALSRSTTDGGGDGPSATVFRASVGYGAKAYVASLLSFLIVRADMLLVNGMRGASDAGVYSIAVQVTDLISLLPVSIAMVLFPRLARDREGDPAFALKVTRHTALLLALLCGAAALLAPPAVSILYGAQFSAAVPALWWLLPGIWALGVTNQISQHFASRGLPLPAVLIWIPPLVLNLLLNIAWIPRWGIDGAAAASTVCYLLALILHLALWSRRSPGTVADALLLRRSDLDEMRDLAGSHPWS